MDCVQLCELSGLRGAPRVFGEIDSWQNVEDGTRWHRKPPKTRED